MSLAGPSVVIYTYILAAIIVRAALQVRAITAVTAGVDRAVVDVQVTGGACSPLLSLVGAEARPLRDIRTHTDVCSGFVPQSFLDAAQ